MFVPYLEDHPRTYLRLLNTQGCLVFPRPLYGWGCDFNTPSIHGRKFMAWLMKLGMGRPNLLTSPAMILQVLTMSSVQFILVGGLIIGDDILPNYIWGLFHIANIRIPMEPIRMTHGMSYRTVSFSWENCSPGRLLLRRRYSRRRRLWRRFWRLWLWRRSRKWMTRWEWCHEDVSTKPMSRLWDVNI